MAQAKQDKPRCVFCNRQNVAFHKEDVLAKWIAKALPGPYVKVTHEVGDLKPYVAKGNFGLVTRAACKGCNGGWMSRLEDAAKPIMLPLMLGQPGELDQRCQTVVAQWMIKTAMMIDCTKSSGGQRFFTPVDFQRFLESRWIPSVTMIHLARVRFPKPVLKMRTYHLPLLMPVGTKTTAVDGYVATLAIHRLALQLFVCRTPEDFDGLLRLSLPRDWPQASITIWPAVPTRIHWPPVYVLDEAGFDDFTNRWRSLKG